MKKLPIGLQLYTVRDEMEKNVSKTLKAVKQIGYDYVETAGALFGIAPKQFKAELDEAGLIAVSAHVSIQRIVEDMDKVISDYKVVGVKYITIPYFASGDRPADPGFGERYFHIMNTFADKCEQNGMTLLYHNHDFEFVRMPNGQYALEYVYDNVPKMQSELDVCWVNVGGEDPAEYLNKFENRCPVVHLKDFVGRKTENMYELIDSDEAKAVVTDEFKYTPLGMGKNDFPKIIESAVKNGAEYLVVEQDNTYDIPSLEAAKISRDYLKTLGL